MFDDHWKKFVGKKESLSDPEACIEISVDQLKSLCSQFYTRGLKDGSSAGEKKAEPKSSSLWESSFWEGIGKWMM